MLDGMILGSEGCYKEEEDWKREYSVDEEWPMRERQHEGRKKGKRTLGNVGCIRVGWSDERWEMGIG